jgi:PKHD-type hydroxylase
MLICISSILSAAELSTIQSCTSSKDYIDGTETAGWAAARVKKNLQLSAGSTSYKKARKIIDGALKRNQVFALAAMPKAMRPILISRYESGMSYGPHVDNALMGDSPQMRTDLAFTLFLNEPDEYEGGELIVDDPGGERDFKLPAGSLVLYPANTLHRVTEVTSGCRRVAVSWIQSLIRDHAKRQILFELESARTVLFLKHGQSAEIDSFTRSTSSLWRMWADP